MRLKLFFVKHFLKRIEGFFFGRPVGVAKCRTTRGGGHQAGVSCHQNLFGRGGHLSDMRRPRQRDDLREHARQSAECQLVERSSRHLGLLLQATRLSLLRFPIDSLSDNPADRERDGGCWRGHDRSFAVSRVAQRPVWHPNRPARHVAQLWLIVSATSHGLGKLPGDEHDRLGRRQRPRAILDDEDAD